MTSENKFSIIEGGGRPEENLVYAETRRNVTKATGIIPSAEEIKQIRILYREWFNCETGVQENSAKEKIRQNSVYEKFKDYFESVFKMRNLDSL